MEYSELSKNITKSLTRKVKKDNGIFFTPPPTIKKSLKIIKENLKIKKVKNVLEPSCGSCEYLDKTIKEIKSENYYGIEYNKNIYEQIKNKYDKQKNVSLINKDFIGWNTKKKFDLIIGNPPYYVMKRNNTTDKYNNYFTGRPNIFILFIIKSLKLLRKNGILSFVLPKNFLNCLYYDKLRKHIYTNFKIIDIVDCSNDKYLETCQDTIIFIVKNMKSKLNHKYSLEISNYTIFNTKENIKELKKLLQNSNSLKNLNFDVSIGSIVWNQHKDKLVDDDKKTLLVYSSDVKNNKLQIQKYNNPRKKNYIDKKGIKEPLLVLNRGYGKGKYKLSYCLLNEKREILIENHLMVIRYKNQIDNKLLLKKYNDIIKSFNNKKTKKFIDIYFCNNAINSIELMNILPIYIYDKN